MGLLTNFIQSKIKEYKEPSRQGTPKGEPIGLSKKKYAAALSCLTDRNFKVLAKEIKVSHGLFLKWRTEEAFSVCIRDAEQEFIKLFIRLIESQVKKVDFSLDDWLIDAKELFEDIYNYNKFFKHNLREYVEIVFKDIPSNDSRRFVYEFFDYALPYRDARTWDPHKLIIEKQLEREAKKHIKTLADDVPILTERAKESLLEYLRTVRTYHHRNIKDILDDMKKSSRRVKQDHHE
jgi:hypothetical protein